MLSALGTCTAVAAAGDTQRFPRENDWRERPAAEVSIGAFDAQDARQRATEAGVQYRLPGTGWGLRPVVGAIATSAGVVNVYGGVSVDVPAGRHLGIRGSFAPGYYTPGRAGKDLGSPLEFRSGLEVSVRLRGGRRLGLEYYHLSNAGLGRINPGQESLVLTLAVPAGRRRSAIAPE